MQTNQLPLFFVAIVVLTCTKIVAATEPQVDQVTASDFEPVPCQTVLGTVFEVRPAWDDSIEATVQRVRTLVNEERRQGKLICYISTPLSSRGGGHRPTNVAISQYVKRRVEAKYGRQHLWALAPGAIENELPVISGKRPGGGEYLYMWTQVLAGEDGQGTDFDMVYFVGPTDMHAYFGVAGGGILGNLSAYIDERAAEDEEFKTTVADNFENRKNFIRYYGIRASATFSTGALDEWNIFRLVNRRREIGDQIAFFFNGQQVSPGASEAPVRPGYEQRDQIQP